MLAEAIHSVADSGNQVLLLVGGRRSVRGRRHSTRSATGGSATSTRSSSRSCCSASVACSRCTRAYTRCSTRRASTSGSGCRSRCWLIGITLESLSFRTAIIEANHVRGGVAWASFIRHARAPELPVILLEDFAALIGLALALFGVGLTLITGNGVWDGIGTLAHRRAAGDRRHRARARRPRACCSASRRPMSRSPRSPAAIAAVTRRRTGIIHMRTMHLGPEELLVAAKIAVARDSVRGADRGRHRRGRGEHPGGRTRSRG